MTFRTFCETALSNDLICVVTNILHGDPAEIKAAYKYLVDNDERLNKKVDRFTYGISEKYDRTILFVKLED